MKTFIVLILSCASVFGADTGIRVVTTARTNSAIAVINTKTVFTRDGQTNLVCFTTTKRDTLTDRSHLFYHGGVLVGEYWDGQDSSGFVTEAGSPNSVIFKYSPSKEVCNAFICQHDRVVVDCFIATNGVFLPADSSATRDANKLGEDVTMHLSQSQK
jgi:hypothetical protein